ncbi:hypothetical protein AZOA_04560 [Azoarcus sp. Aa7]|nr:hypothetical protein [Azoarcus sp. Aa7]
MKAIETRLAALESKLAAMEQRGTCAIVLEDGEDFAAACTRLGIKDGGYLVVRRILTAEEFAQCAPEQQRRLLDTGDD